MKKTYLYEKSMWKGGRKTNIRDKKRAAGALVSSPVWLTYFSLNVLEECIKSLVDAIKVVVSETLNAFADERLFAFR